MVVFVNAFSELKLAPPGAGLPTPELYIGRLLFAVRRRTGSRESLNLRFQRERERIRQLVRSCAGDLRAQRVLIKRPRGLEDSSRNWSVWMTLDHLRIVHHSMADIIGSLARGEPREGVASTAAVKPSVHATAAVEGEYEQSCDKLLATVAATRDLKTRLRFAHPWFGPLDAAGWHALAAGHIGIHRVQIERIVVGVKPKP